MRGSYAGCILGLGSSGCCTQVYVYTVIAAITRTIGLNISQHRQIKWDWSHKSWGGNAMRCRESTSTSSSSCFSPSVFISDSLPFSFSSSTAVSMFSFPFLFTCYVFIFLSLSAYMLLWLTLLETSWIMELWFLSCQYQHDSLAELIALTEMTLHCRILFTGDDGDEGYVGVELPEYACKYCATLGSHHAFLFACISLHLSLQRSSAAGLLIL